MDTDIDNLLAKVLRGETTRQEQKIFEQWKKKSNNEEVFLLMKKAWHQSHQENIPPGMQQRKQELINEFFPRQRKHSGIPWLHKLAATFIILLGATAIIWYLSNQFSEDGASNDIPLVSKINPPGVKSTFKLPDGTMVYLNASSSLEYNRKFASGQRSVTLKGEAFFDVVRDTLSPFTVTTDQIITTVLGTSFGVKEFMGEDPMVAVAEGKVKVESTDRFLIESPLLTEGEYTMLLNDQWLEDNFEYDKVFGWKDDILVFDQSSFDDIIKVLSRWYGVRIHYDGKVPKWSFNGKFQDENLEHILEILSHSEKFSYRLKGKEVYLEL